MSFSPTPGASQAAETAEKDGGLTGENLARDTEAGTEGNDDRMIEQRRENAGDDTAPSEPTPPV